MIRPAVQLRYSPHPQRPSCARFVAGSNAADWLCELAAWDVPLDELALYVVPQSAADLTPRGVLVVHPRCAAAGAGPQYGRVGDRLYAPVEAVFQPAVADAEWPALLGPCVDYVWHPQVGLVGFEAADRLRVGDLLEFPEPLPNDWSLADPGVAETSRLLSLMVPAPPSIQMFLESGRDDIGVDAPKMKDLPPAPGERWPRLPPLPSLPQFLLTPFAYIARALTRRAPTGAGAPTWVNKVEDWARRVLIDWDKVWNARRRELNRLLQLLESNPDEGLRYALPSSGFAHRGVAPPGTHLRPHDLDYGARRGAGPADIWDIPFEIQAQLNAKYRALADREVALGRYRRAAYIHAELLNDYAAAAAVLAKGGHFREAAAIYKDRLHRPWDAARCLEEAGLLHEAIPLYAELKNFEKVGDLHAKLDELDAACGAWKQAVDQFVLNRDALNAARICDVKLQDPDAAIDTLLVGWRAAWQSEQCLVEMFRLLGRLGRHESALRRLDVLREWNDPADREPSPQPERELPFAPRSIVGGLAAIFEQYPDERVRATAADVARVATSRALVSRHVEGHVCARLIERLAPADRLLGRDCRRYVGERNRPKTVKPVLQRHANRAKGPEYVRTIARLHSPAQWHRCVGTARGIYVAGSDEQRVALGRISWGADADDRWLSWTGRGLGSAPLLLAVDPDERSPFIVIVPVGGPPLHPHLVRTAGDFPHSVSAETPGWLADGTVAIDFAEGTLWSLDLPAHVVKCTDRTGVLLRSYGLANVQLAYPDGDEPQFALHARPGEAYASINHCLWRIAGSHQELHECQSRIHAVTGTAPYTRTRVAVFCEHGGEVWWPLHRGGPWARFEDADHPIGTFLRDGRLVVCTRTVWRVYDTRRDRLELQAEIAAPAPDVWAVLRAPAANEFAVCLPGGIELYQCPPAAAE